VGARLNSEILVDVFLQNLFRWWWGEGGATHPTFVVRRYVSLQINDTPNMLHLLGSRAHTRLLPIRFQFDRMDGFKRPISNLGRYTLLLFSPPQSAPKPLWMYSEAASSEWSVLDTGSAKFDTSRASTLKGCSSPSFSKPGPGREVWTSLRAGPGP
jgi:hypothetical protein